MSKTIDLSAVIHVAGVRLADKTLLPSEDVPAGQFLEQFLSNASWRQSAEKLDTRKRLAVACCNGGSGVVQDADLTVLVGVLQSLPQTQLAIEIAVGDLLQILMSAK